MLLTTAFILSALAAPVASERCDELAFIVVGVKGGGAKYQKSGDIQRSLPDFDAEKNKEKWIYVYHNEKLFGGARTTFKFISPRLDDSEKKKTLTVRSAPLSNPTPHTVPTYPLSKEIRRQVDATFAPKSTIKGTGDEGLFLMPLEEGVSRVENIAVTFHSDIPPQKFDLYWLTAGEDILLKSFDLTGRKFNFRLTQSDLVKAKKSREPNIKPEDPHLLELRAASGDQKRRFVVMFKTAEIPSLLNTKMGFVSLGDFFYINDFVSQNLEEKRYGDALVELAKIARKLEYPTYADMAKRNELLQSQVDQVLLLAKLSVNDFNDLLIAAP